MDRPKQSNGNKKKQRKKEESVWIKIKNIWIQSKHVNVKKAFKICWFGGGKASKIGGFVCADICELLQANGLRVLSVEVEKDFKIYQQ